MDESIRNKLDKIYDTGKMLSSLGIEPTGSASQESIGVDETNHRIVTDLLHNKNKGILVYLTVAGITPKEFGVTVDEVEPPIEVVIGRFDNARIVITNTIDELSMLPTATGFNFDLYEMFKDNLSQVRANLQEDFYQRFRKDENCCVLLKISVLHHSELTVGLSLELCSSKNLKRTSLVEYGYFLQEK